MNRSLAAPKLLIPAVLAAAAIGLAACGSNDRSGGDASAASSETSGDTVGVSTIDGSQVLVDASGNALYSPDQEASGKISCTGPCESIWVPLTVSNGSMPTASSDVTGELGTVKRPGGSTQVTLDGAPLYSFTDDGGPGKVTGDDFSDRFDGRSFDWHVITVGGSAPPSGGSGYSY